MPNEPNKTKVGSQTLVQRENRATTRNLGPEGGAKSPLKQSMDSVPVVTQEKRKTGKVG